MSDLPASSRLTLRPDLLSKRAASPLSAGILLLGTALYGVWLARVGWHVPDRQWQGTTIDGGRRDADVSRVAETLMGSQRTARNLSALATRDDIPDAWAIAPSLFQRGTEGRSVAAFLARLGSDQRTPTTTSAYLYLPLRLLRFVPLINRLRLRAGPVTQPPDHRLMEGAKVGGNRIHLGTVEVDAAALTLTEAGSARPLETIDSVRGTGPTFEPRTRTKHPEAPTSAGYLHAPGVVSELDAFEPVYGNAAVRTFKACP